MDLTGTLYVAVISFCIFTIGAGIGVTITVQDFKDALSTPKSVIIGLISQCLFMPFCCYIFVLILDLNALQAAGLILVGCAPGGGFSNLLTLWIKGDVSLSITMTTASTIFASFMIPINVQLYLVAALGLDGEIQMDWFGLYFSLGVILLGTSLGMAIKHNKPDSHSLHWWVEISASVLGLAILLGIFIYRMIDGVVDYMASTTWKVIVGGWSVEPISLLFGYGLAWMAGLQSKICQTISLETGVQNVGLIIALIELSFEEDEIDEVQQFPFMIGIAYFFWTFLALGIYRLEFFVAPDVVEFENQSTELAETKKDLPV